MLPYKLTFDHTQDITGTKEWIDSLITKENLPTILTHYNFSYYIYRRNEEDPHRMPNYHYFGFTPKDKSQITPQRLEYLHRELIRRTLITNSLEELQSGYIENNYNICLILKATD